jgi:hypothetical protein
MWHLYVIDGRVILPTMAQTEAGFYWDIEPCFAVDLSDLQDLRSAIEAMVARGNPKVPTPPREAFKKPVVLQFTAAKSWQAFEKKASVWTISLENGEFVISRERRARGGGWEHDPERVYRFGEQSLQSVSERFVEIIQRDQLE